MTETFPFIASCHLFTVLDLGNSTSYQSINLQTSRGNEASNGSFCSQKHQNYCTWLYIVAMHIVTWLLKECMNLSRNQRYLSFKTRDVIFHLSLAKVKTTVNNPLSERAWENAYSNSYWCNIVEGNLNKPIENLNVSILVFINSIPAE